MYSAGEVVSDATRLMGNSELRTHACSREGHIDVVVTLPTERDSDNEAPPWGDVIVIDANP